VREGQGRHGRRRGPDRRRRAAAGRRWRCASTPTARGRSRRRSRRSRRSAPPGLELVEEPVTA
jgi:hypothetical protein